MATPADDYSEQSFYWHEFINEMAPLNAQTAMQYFETSPWYRIEPPSNNQILRMQMTGMDANQVNELEQLRGLVGVEFAVALDQGPNLFVIHKRRRVSPDEVHPLEAYYIINNHIQQSPSLYALLSTRLNSSVHHLMSSMEILRGQRPSFTPTKGHAWPILFDPTTAFVKDGGASSKRTVAGSVDGSTMDTDTPAAGPRESSVRPGDHALSAANDTTQITTTMPLLQAIRTTAGHVQRELTQSAGDGTKRVIRSAMALGVPEPQADESDALSMALASVQNSQQAGAGQSSSDATVTHPSARRISAPKVATPFPGMEAGTPLRKKKKRAGTKDTPISTRSPMPPAA